MPAMPQAVPHQQRPRRWRCSCQRPEPVASQHSASMCPAQRAQSAQRCPSSSSTRWRWAAPRNATTAVAAAPARPWPPAPRRRATLSVGRHTPSSAFAKWSPPSSSCSSTLTSSAASLPLASSPRYPGSSTGRDPTTRAGATSWLRRSTRCKTSNAARLQPNVPKRRRMTPAAAAPSRTRRSLAGRGCFAYAFEG